MHTSVGIISTETCPHSGQVSWQVVFIEELALCTTAQKPHVDVLTDSRADLFSIDDHYCSSAAVGNELCWQLRVPSSH